MKTVSTAATTLHVSLGTNNVYIVPDAAGATLIDAGPDYDGAWSELGAKLDAIGIAATSIHTVVLTHHHLDHAGLAARWQTAGARIVAGRADAPALAMDGAARERERALARVALLDHGVPPEMLATPAGSGERYTRWPAALRMTPVQADLLVADGDLVGADRPLRVVECPGHTPGTILLLDERTGQVFTGDHVLPRMAATAGIQFDGQRRRPSLPRFLASLHAARGLADRPGRALPGHGKPIADLSDAIDWTVRFIEQRTRRAHGHLRAGPATAYDLAVRMFPHLGPARVRPAMAETLGLLDLLAERGLAVCDQSRSPAIWTAAIAEPASTEA